MIEIDIWTYRVASDLGVDVGPDVDLVDYAVEALDGSIGKVDESQYGVGSSWIVVDTGPWFWSKKVLLPAGVIDRIDPEEKKVYVHRTKDEIKNAPHYDVPDYDRSWIDKRYLRDVGGYYGPSGAGWRDWDQTNL